MRYQHRDWTQCAEKQPVRQAFYYVRLADGEESLAKWEALKKGDPKGWHAYVADDPTHEKKPVALDGVTAWAPAAKAEVDAHLKRELTVAEKIEAAFTNYVQRNNLYSAYTPTIPDARRLVPGVAIQVGALRECKVVDVREAGQIVVFQYRDIKHNYGKELDRGISYMAVHWTSAVPLEGQREDCLVQDNVAWAMTTQTTLDSLVSRIRRGLVDNPDYQRGYVWSSADRESFIDSLFKGRELGRFIFVKYQYPREDEILDGKQRLTCLADFMNSQFSYRGVYWHELNGLDRSHIESRMVQFVDLKAANFRRSQLLQMFLEVNTAGVPQTPEHVAHVRRMLEVELAKEAAAAKQGQSVQTAV